MPVGVPGLPTKRPSACAYLSMPSLRKVRNAVPGVTSLSPSFSPRRNGPRPLNSLPRPSSQSIDAVVGNAAQHGVADIGAAAVLDVVADRIAAARIADQRHARRAGAALQFLDGLAEFAALVLGRGAVRLLDLSSVRASGSVKLIANIRSRATPLDSIRHSVVIHSAAWSPLPWTNRIGGIPQRPARRARSAPRPRSRNGRPARAGLRRPSGSSAAIASFYYLPCFQDLSCAVHR